MAVRGIAIGAVDNILDSEDIVGTEKLPVSSGQTVPQVVTTEELRDYINVEPLSGISNLTIRMDNLPEVESLTNSEIDRLIR